MSKQTRGWFFTGPANRLKTNDKPIQGTFQNLLDSCVNVLQDFATMTQPGIVTLANNPFPEDLVNVDGVTYAAVPTSKEVDNRIAAAIPSGSLTTTQPLVIDAAGLNSSIVNLKPATSANLFVKTNASANGVEWGSPIGRTNFEALAYSLINCLNSVGFVPFFDYRLQTWVAGSFSGSQYMDIRCNLKIVNQNVINVGTHGTSVLQFTLPYGQSVPKRLVFPARVFASPSNGPINGYLELVDTTGRVRVTPNIGTTIDALSEIEIDFCVQVPLGSD